MPQDKKPSGAQRKVLDAAQRRVLVRSNGSGRPLYRAYCTDGTPVREPTIDALDALGWIAYEDDPNPLLRGRWVITAAGVAALTR